MKPIPAIVEPAQVDVEGIAQQIIVALADERHAETSATRFEQQATAARETARMRRLEIGRWLLKVRGAWPKSGPSAKGWSAFLARVKLDDSTAVRYMDAARTSAVHGDGAGTGGRPDRADPPDRDSAQQADVSQISESELADRIGKLDADARGRIMRSLRSSVASERNGDRDAYCTPPEITALLPEVDLDPCSNPRSTVRAQTTYSLEANQNGLELPWFGLIYANVPYSAPLPWAEKHERERANLIGAGFLVNADHSPAWWKLLRRHLHLRLDFDERIEFSAPPGVEPSKNDRPQTLLMDDAFWEACSQVELLKLGTLWRIHNP